MSSSYLTSSWVINKKQDLLWVIGSVLASYLFLSLYYGLNHFGGFSLAASGLVIYFLWIVVFDGTHVFATYTRTYFDNDFRQRNRGLIYGGLALLLIGPLYMTLFYTLGTQEQYRAAFLFFNRFGILYAYYHLIRQHWGFISLYNRKAGGCSLFQSKLESIILWSGVLFPLVYHHIYHYVPLGLAEKLAADITLNDWFFLNIILWAMVTIIFGSKFIFQSNKIKNVLTYLTWIFFFAATTLSIILYLGLETLLQHLLFFLGFIFLSSVIIYTLYCVYKRKEIKVSYQKILLLFLVIGTHNFILMLSMPYVIAYACITVFHNIQYHGVVRFHNKNKYLEDGNRYGWATKLTRNLFLFLVLALAFNFISTLPRAALNFVKIDEFFIYVAASFFWGIAFHHYVFDSIIWRPSKDKEISKNLKLETATATTPA